MNITKVLTVTGCGIAAVCTGVFTGALFTVSNMFYSTRRKYRVLGTISGMLSLFCAYQTVHTLMGRRPTGLLDVWPRR